MKFELESHNIFPTYVWKVTAQEVNNELLKTYALSLAKADPGVKISNKGGWHSGDFVIPPPDELKKLMAEFEAGVNMRMSQETGITNLKIGNVWININSPGDYNLLHDHQNSILSGVYYVSVPEDNMGDLVLVRKDNSEYFLKNVELNPFTMLSLALPIKEGIAYFFPSWLQHRVEKNESNSQRISIAFNLVIES